MMCVCVCTFLMVLLKMCIWTARFSVCCCCFSREYAHKICNVDEWSSYYFDDKWLKNYNKLFSSSYILSYKFTGSHFWAFFLLNRTSVFNQMRMKDKENKIVKTKNFEAEEKTHNTHHIQGTIFRWSISNEFVYPSAERLLPDKFESNNIKRLKLQNDCSSHFSFARFASAGSFFFSFVCPSFANCIWFKRNDKFNFWCANVCPKKMCCMFDEIKMKKQKKKKPK